MASYLLDTHTFLWFATDAPELSARAKSLIEDEANERLVSMASLWEIAIKVSTGKLTTPGNFAELQRRARKSGISFLPLSFGAVEYVSTMPRLHGDPFDRLIVGTCVTDGYTLISRDWGLDQYGVVRVW